MPAPPDLRDTVVGAWKTNNQVTVFLLEHLPEELWEPAIPEMPRRSIRMIAGHMHNSRCTWINTLGRPHGIAVPRSVDRRSVKRKDLVQALRHSSSGITSLLEFGCAHGGSIPPTPAYTWRNLPLDVGHVLGYFIAHEGHHRGQIVMLARQLGHRLPADIAGGLWDWTKRAREVRGSRP